VGGIVSSGLGGRESNSKQRRGEEMGKMIKWVIFAAAIVVAAIVGYSIVIAPILKRGWVG